MPGTAVPFRWITDLPPSAQKEIERDFLHVQSEIGSYTIFDAIIDPSLTSSDPGTHTYKNLTDLVANETWSAYYNFMVGVKQRSNPRISEPTSPLDISANGNLSLFGLGPVTPDNVNTKGWDWATLTCAAGQTVHYYNLSFQPTSAGG